MYHIRRSPSRVKTATRKMTTYDRKVARIFKKPKKNAKRSQRKSKNDTGEDLATGAPKNVTKWLLEAFCRACVSIPWILAIAVREMFGIVCCIVIGVLYVALLQLVLMFRVLVDRALLIVLSVIDKQVVLSKQFENWKNLFAGIASNYLFENPFKGSTFTSMLSFQSNNIAWKRQNYC